MSRQKATIFINKTRTEIKFYYNIIKIQVKYLKECQPFFRNVISKSKSFRLTIRPEASGRTKRN